MRVPYFDATPQVKDRQVILRSEKLLDSIFDKMANLGAPKGPKTRASVAPSPATHAISRLLKAGGQCVRHLLHRKECFSHSIQSFR